MTKDALIYETASLRLEGRSQLDPQMRSLSSDVREITVGFGSDNVPTEALLQLAAWSATGRRWAEAGYYYDLAASHEPLDWEVQLLRGVAHSNSRLSRKSDLAALTAYDAALALRPDDAPLRLVARLFIYRGAIKKRLGVMTRRKWTSDSEVRWPESLPSS